MASSGSGCAGPLMPRPLGDSFLIVSQKKSGGEIMRIILIALISIFFTSCGHVTSNEESEPKFQANQIPGCVKGLPKNNPSLNNYFNYSFGETLKVDLCLPSNCCPDSYRFDYSYILSDDTIKVSVFDIEEHLCRCMCDYMVHSEIVGLEQDEYIFECIYYDSVFYCQNVSRN